MVSIIIPTFNRADFLENTLLHCINQTIECEIIVSDHGSTDSTPELMKKYAERVTYIRKDKDFGPHFCWLDGIINAKNDLIHIQYDDDWIEPDFIEKCLSKFDDETAFVFTKSKIYKQNEGTYLDLFSNFGKTGFISPKKVVDFALTGNVINPACAIFRKEDLIDNLFIYKVPHAKNHYRGVGPDTLFSIMTSLKYKKVGFIDEYLAIFRVHDGSITISSFKSKETKSMKALAYEDAHKYYLISKFAKSFRLGDILLWLYNFTFLNKWTYVQKLFFYGYRIVFLKQKYVS